MQASSVQRGQAEKESSGQSGESSEGRLLAAEFQLFQPLDGFALVGDDLRLPD